MVQKTRSCLWHHQFQWLFSFFVPSFCVSWYSARRELHPAFQALLFPTQDFWLDWAVWLLLRKTVTPIFTNQKRVWDILACPSSCLRRTYGKVAFPLMNHTGHTQQSELLVTTIWLFLLTRKNLVHSSSRSLSGCLLNAPWSPIVSPGLFCSQGEQMGGSSRLSSLARCSLVWCLWCTTLLVCLSDVPCRPGPIWHISPSLLCVTLFLCQPLHCGFHSSFLPQNISLCNFRDCAAFLSLWVSSPFPDQSKGVHSPTLVTSPVSVKTSLHL